MNTQNQPSTLSVTEPLVILTHTQYMQLLKYRDDYEAEVNKGANDAVNTLEKDLNLSATPKGIVFKYEDKQYAKVTDSKIKFKGILDKLLAHPKLGPAIKSTITPIETTEMGKIWFPVVVYEALYENPDGKTWVRMKDDFDSKFKPKE